MLSNSDSGVVPASIVTIRTIHDTRVPGFTSSPVADGGKLHVESTAKLYRDEAGCRIDNELPAGNPTTRWNTELPGLWGAGRDTRSTRDSRWCAGSGSELPRCHRSGN